jgi:uncharacterized membrane protein
MSSSGVPRNNHSKPSRERKTASALNATQNNVAAVIAIEQESLASRSKGERLGDAIARHAGKMWFISAHAVWFTVWLILNSGMVAGVPRFDPYPFQFLNFVVSLEAIFLALFILMSQNRSSRQADARAHLDLQINLLAEQESTKTLQMLQKLCEFHGLTKGHDPELQQLTSTTKPEDLLQELRENMPEES